MKDYSSLSNVELNNEISSRMGVVDNWLLNAAATWRALQELPGYSLDTVPIIHAYVVTFDCEQVEAPSPARAVWIAWLGWQDSKRAAGDVHVMVRSLHDEPGVAPIDALKACLDEIHDELEEAGDD